MSGVCFALQIRLYIFTRSCINYSAPVITASTSISRPISPSNVDPRNAAAVLNPASSTASSFERRHQCITGPTRRSNRKITGPEGQQLNRLEVRAARTLTLGILPFCLINLPVAVFFAVFQFYPTQFGSGEHKSMDFYRFDLPTRAHFVSFDVYPDCCYVCH